MLAKLVNVLIIKLIFLVREIKFFFLLRIRQANLPLRFCTNETQLPRNSLLKKLRGLGFSLSEEEIHAPTAACCSYITEHNLRPYLVVHPKARPEYEQLDISAPNAVVLGDAAEEFTYQNLNRAFQILMEEPKPTLISLGQGYRCTMTLCMITSKFNTVNVSGIYFFCSKYYKEGGSLVLDVGPFAKALEV